MPRLRPSALTSWVVLAGRSRARCRSSASPPAAPCSPCSARGALLTAAGLIAISALITAAGLRTHPPRATGRAGVAATWRVDRELLGSPAARPLLLAAWVPNGLIVGAEAMYVPYAGATAGVLFMAGAAGMLLGDLVVGRWVPAAARERLASPLQALLAVPYLLFVLRPGPVVAAVAVFVASAGYGGTLGLQQRLLRVIPARLTGQAIGLEGSGRMTWQALGAAAVGAVAELTGAATAMTVAGLASLLVTAALWRPLGQNRKSAPVARRISQTLP